MHNHMLYDYHTNLPDNTHIIMIIKTQTLENKRITKEQTMMNRGIQNSRTNRSTPRKASLERAKMIIRKNDGPVSRPWKANLS